MSARRAGQVRHAIAEAPPRWVRRDVEVDPSPPDYAEFQRAITRGKAGALLEAAFRCARFDVAETERQRAASVARPDPTGKRPEKGAAADLGPAIRHGRDLESVKIADVTAPVRSYVRDRMTVEVHRVHDPIRWLWRHRREAPRITTRHVAAASKLRLDWESSESPGGHDMDSPHGGKPDYGPGERQMAALRAFLSGRDVILGADIHGDAVIYLVLRGGAASVVAAKYRLTLDMLVAAAVRCLSALADAYGMGDGVEVVE